MWKTTDFSNMESMILTSGIKDNEIYELKLQYAIYLSNKDMKKYKKYRNSEKISMVNKKKFMIGASITMSAILAITGGLLFNHKRRKKR